MTMKQRILAEIQKCREIASSRGYNLPEIPIDFSLKGGCAGKHVYKKANGKPVKMCFNLEIAERHPDEFIKRTVYHEAAHCLQFIHYPNSKPHGREWDHFCRVLTGATMPRCHDYDVSGIKREKKKLTRYKYVCDCNTPHNVTSIKHNRIQNGSCYICINCRSKLRRPITVY